MITTRLLLIAVLWFSWLLVNFQLLGLCAKQWPRSRQLFDSAAVLFGLVTSGLTSIPLGALILNYFLPGHPFAEAVLPYLL